MPLYLSLHHGESEVAYPGYERATLTFGDVVFARDKAVNCREIGFPRCASDFSGDASFFGIGISPTGLRGIRGFGRLDKPLTVQQGITPVFAAGQLRITFDIPDLPLIIQHLKEKEIPCQK